LHDIQPKNPLIIPVFIPNQGCPHRCVFCRQETIVSEGARVWSGREVTDVIEKAVRHPGFNSARRPEVAFYGGTFTGLPEKRMVDLLQSVQPYIQSARVSSIRISTRPDSLGERRVEILREFGVRTVELGAQSMDDRVLELSHRGHTSEDTVRSVGLLKRNGLDVGLQLMPGLPGDTESSFLETVDRVIELRPQMARIYPTLVLRGTELEGQYLAGRYRPLSLVDAVRLCEEACRRLEENSIPVIRIGILNAPSLAKEGEIVAGPWHDSFGFLVRCGIYYRRIESLLPGPGGGERLRLHLPPRELPLIRGYRNEGVKRIQVKTGARVIEIRPDPSLPGGTIKVEKL
jgi:histone acetyltransferase (RNA polymerase elongator complex component)